MATAGQPIQILALGSNANTGAKPENAWARRVFAWFQAVFPNNDHRLITTALPTCISAYVLATLPTDVDLVLLEVSSLSLLHLTG